MHDAPCAKNPVYGAPLLIFPFPSSVFNFLLHNQVLSLLPPSSNLLPHLSCLFSPPTAVVVKQALLSSFSWAGEDHVTPSRCCTTMLFLLVMSSLVEDASSWPLVPPLNTTPLRPAMPCLRGHDGGGKGAERVQQWWWQGSRRWQRVGYNSGGEGTVMMAVRVATRWLRGWNKRGLQVLSIGRGRRWGDLTTFLCLFSNTFWMWLKSQFVLHPQVCHAPYKVRCMWERTMKYYTPLFNTHDYSIHMFEDHRRLPSLRIFYTSKKKRRFFHTCLL